MDVAQMHIIENDGNGLISISSSVKIMDRHLPTSYQRDVCVNLNTILSLRSENIFKVGRMTPQVSSLKLVRM